MLLLTIYNYNKETERHGLKPCRSYTKKTFQSLFHDNFLEFRKPGQRVLLRQLGFALDQR